MRLVDADALFENIYRKVRRPTEKQGDEDLRWEWDSGWDAAIDEALNVIGSAPSVRLKIHLDVDTKEAN